jgi:hypothetical protein
VTVKLPSAINAKYVYPSPGVIPLVTVPPVITNGGIGTLLL